MNFYETLGVAASASAEDIKTAFRKCAAAAHPDRQGGSNERMQAVNNAYAVLSDPQRRKEYDATGRDSGGRQTVQAMAAELLVAVFGYALDNDIEPVLHARSKLIGVGDQLKAKRPELATRRQKLEARSGKTTLVRAGAGDNLVQMLIDQRLQRVKSEQAELEQAIAANAEALRMLSAYSAPPAEPVTPFAQYTAPQWAAWQFPQA